MMIQAIPRRTRLAGSRDARTDRPEVTAVYGHARLRYELAEAVRLRREELLIPPPASKLAEGHGQDRRNQDR
jgi:hypothetical protein